MNNLSVSPLITADHVQAMNESLRRLASKLGPKVFNIRLEIDPNLPYAAATSAKCVYLSEKTVIYDAHNTEVYLAHEIFHHVVDDVEQTHEYPAHVVNKACDYRINQWLKKYLGYDVHKVYTKGFLNPEYDDLTLKEICAILHTTDGTQSYPHPSHTLSSPALLELAYETRRRLGLPSPRTYFVLDGMDNSVMLNTLPELQAEVRLRTIRNVNVQRLVEGLFSHLYLPRARHNVKAIAKAKKLRLNPSASLSYCIDADLYRSDTVGDEMASAIAASYIVEAFDSDQYALSKAVSSNANRIRVLTNELQARKTRKNSDNTSAIRNLSLPKLKASLARALARRERLKAMSPLHLLLLRDSVYVRSGIKTKMPSLQTAMEEVEQGSVVLPNLIGNELSRRIRLASRRAYRDFEAYKEANKQVSSKVSSLFSDTSKDPKEMQDLSPGASTEETHDQIDVAVNQEEEQTDRRAVDSSKAGKQKSDPKPSKFKVQKMLANNAYRLLQVIAIMDEVKALLSSRSTQRVSDDPALATMFSYGDDLENVDASEFALLASPETRTDFYVRLAQGTLLQRQPRQRKEAAVVICVDTSGSMQGNRLDVALGFTLAFASRLASHGRGLALVLFDSSVYASFLFEEQPSLIKLLQCFERVSVGGTLFQPPMEHAFDLRDQQQWKKLVMLMITDGEAALDDVPRLQQRKTKHDVLQAILVGGKAKLQSDEDGELFDDVFTIKQRDLLLTLVNTANKIL